MLVGGQQHSSARVEYRVRRRPASRAWTFRRRSATLVVSSCRPQIAPQSLPIYWRPLYLPTALGATWAILLRPRKDFSHLDLQPAAGGGELPFAWRVPC